MNIRLYNIIDLRDVRAVAGHGVVRLVAGELEAVVAAGSTASVELLAAEAGDQARLPRLEVRHLVQMSLSGSPPSVFIERP